MAGYRAGYELDYGLRDFDNRRPRLDVGSHGYDRGFRRPGLDRPEYDRPWVGGYRGGYQGGSAGVSVGTEGRSVAIRDELQDRYDRYGRGHERGYRRSSYDRGFRGRDPEHREMIRRMRYGTDYEVRPEEYHPRYSPIGGMAPAMGGSYKYQGNRAWPYDRWFNEWTRWF